MDTVKLKYLARSIKNFNQSKSCPFCGSKKNEVIDTKYVFTKLLRCSDCQLQFRFPKDDPKFLEKFYQTEYSIDTLLITKQPSDEEVETLKKEGFPMVKHFEPYIDAITDQKNLKLLDYGCSWGYALYPLNLKGYDVMGFEVSRSRASFGKEKLGVNIVSDFKQVPAGFDFIFCSHVIEHLTDIQELIDNAKSRLKPGGLLMVFCPNGNKEYREREPDLFHVNWGFLHPNYIDTPFLQTAFKDYPYYIMTDDWEYDLSPLKNWDKNSQKVGDKKNGKELFITARLG
jgi:2-polyprenyl-3-methyl-5-hydroxy-6-metoxy-1,4-benzoquinol methylase